MYRVTERLLVPLTALYIFESRYTWQAFTQNIAILPQHAFIINYNGASPDAYHPTQKWNHHLPDAIKLIVVGSLQTIKGQHIAIQAVAQLRQKHKHISNHAQAVTFTGIRSIAHSGQLAVLQILKLATVSA